MIRNIALDNKNRERMLTIKAYDQNGRTTMKRFVYSAVLLGGSMLIGTAAMAKTQIEFWHAMGGVLNERVDELVKKFNESQDQYTVVPVNKGKYEELINAMIAAYRAKSAPT